MPTTFTAFTASNREPNTVYNTAEVAVPDNGDRMVRFTITPPEFLIDEPDTTLIYYEIQIADGPGQPFRHSVSGSFVGLGGITPPKPAGRMATSMPVVGSVVRGQMYFEVADGKRRRFGVSGETY